MLVSFSVSDYRAFSGSAEISMKAESITENQETLLEGGYLPALVIFGPNGSGKSSLVSALGNLIRFIKLPLLTSGNPLRLLDSPSIFSDGDESSFRIAYSSGRSFYRYALSVRDGEISSEKLERMGSEEGRASLLFSRTRDEIRYHGLLKSIGVADVPQDIPLFTLLRSEHPGNEVIEEAYSGIAEGFAIADREKAWEQCDERTQSLMLGMLSEMGFDITAVQDGNVFHGSGCVPVSGESSGIRELLSFLPYVAESLISGRTLIADAPVPSLHPALSAYIVRLFTDHASNRNGASLILASSDISLMDIKVLRRDEIYIAGRKDGGAALSRLTSLRLEDGQAIRKDARLLRSYMEGAYGGFPQLSRVINWDKDGTERKTGSRKLFSINNRRYLGNKFRITRFIREIVDTHCHGTESFADIFSGTGSVSYAFRDKKLILNDFLYSNYLANLAWFSPEHFDREAMENLIDRYNSLCIDEDNYMSENFSDTYFSGENCRKIGWIREDIERRYRTGEINMREKAILVTSLLYAMDRIAATCGHYDAYREGADLGAQLELRMLDADESNNSGNEIFSEDTNALVQHIKADTVYIDPPYNSRQYSDAYHLLENVARWEKPEVKGKARKMDRKGIKSLYSTARAEEAFSELIASINAKYILLSYNNMQDKGDSRSNAKISDETIMSVLSRKGDVTVFSTSHRAFSAGKSHIDGNEERIFLCCVRSREKKQKGFIESPLNYIGGKGRIIHDLLDAFPSEIDTFVDLFAGGCTVGVNAPCRRVIFNDYDARLVSLLREMRRSDKDAFIGDICRVIEQYGLSRSDINGYAYYGADSSKGLGNVNKEAYMHLRCDFNRLSLDEHMRAVMLYVLIIYGFNNQIRFNDDGDFNLPVGKRDFNVRMQEKLSSFIDRIKELDAVFLDSDFRTVQIPAGSFVYADPPYLITTATYNEKHGWTESDETSLHSILESLTERGIKFALSNTLRSRGKENTFLISWLERHPEYRVIHVDRSYANSSYHIKDREAESDEVIILNY